MSNVQSIVTPVTNGAVPAKAPKASKAKLNGTTSLVKPDAKMTLGQACEIGFEYGKNLAGADGTLTKALKAFDGEGAAIKAIEHSIAEGYMVRKLSYTREQAVAAIGKLGHNDKKQDDHHRTFDEQRVMNTVRVMMTRAFENAGIERPKSEAQKEAQVKAELARNEKDAQKKAQEAQREEAWDIVHPKEETDVNEAMRRLVSTMQAYHSKHAAKFGGNTGMAWRDWLAKAPK
jgi:hypothetical protein